MQDDRFAPASHLAKAPENEMGTAGEGVASVSSDPNGKGPDGTAAAGAGSGVPVGTRIDAAVAADLQTKDAVPAPRNVAPAREPVAKTFPESWREDVAGDLSGHDHLVAFVYSVIARGQ